MNKDSPARRVPGLCAGYSLPGFVGYPLPALVQRVVVMSRCAGRVLQSAMNTRRHSGTDTEVHAGHHTCGFEPVRL